MPFEDYRKKAFNESDIVDDVLEHKQRAIERMLNDLEKKVDFIMENTQCSTHLYLKKNITTLRDKFNQK